MKRVGGMWRGGGEPGQRAGSNREWAALSEAHHAPSQFPVACLSAQPPSCIPPTPPLAPDPLLPRPTRHRHLSIHKSSSLTLVCEASRIVSLTVCSSFFKFGKEVFRLAKQTHSAFTSPRRFSCLWDTVLNTPVSLSLRGNLKWLE